MKVKIHFDKKAIGNFFLEHSEKVLLGAFIIVFMVILYGAAVRREKFDKNPAELAANCGKAKQSLAGERPELLSELTKEQQAREDKGDYKKDADKIAEFNKQGISVTPYECDVPLDKPLFGQRGKRGQPELYDVEELRIAADFGAFQVQVADASGGGAAAPPPPPGGGRTRAPVTRVTGNTAIRGKHWVVITGLVPVEMQASAYRKALGDSVAYDPVNDVPTYAGYFVERAEINSPADEQNPKFTKKFNSVDAETEAIKDWSQQLPDVVESKYVDPILTFPLGPLQSRAWGPNVAHAPKIPLLFGMDGDAGDRADADNPPPADAGPPPGQNRGAPGMRGGTRNPMVRTDRGAGYGVESSAYKLLRFFDFNVEPGKSYIYRVSLALKNPNFQVDAGKLEKAEFAKEKYLYTNPPTNDKPMLTERVDVPKDTQVLVGAAKSDDLGPGKFPVVLLTWAQKGGRSGYFSLPNIDHGQVLNFLDKKIDPAGDESPAPASTDTDDMKADLITDATLLDMDGGKKYTLGKDRKSTVPREMLFMVVNGKSINLMLREELDDMSEINRITTKSETAPVPDRRGSPIRGATDPRDLLRGGGDPGRGRPPARP
jgi:hypothetical protein